MLDVLRILLKWRRPMVSLAVVAAVGAAAWAFLATPRYYAQASILPPNDDDASFGGLSALLQQYQVPIPGGVHTPFLPTLYASIVGSRRMGTRILDEFQLRPVFKAATEEDALTTLRARTLLKYTEEGLFLVGFEDSNAKRGADVVNAYVKHLDELIQEVNAAKASQTRGFIERQIERCSGDLRGAEDSLRDFQREHRAVQIDAQTAGAIELAGALQARILGAEVELEMLRQKARSAAPEVRQKTQELQAMRRQYQDLVSVQPKLSASERTDSGLFPSFESVPDLALQYLRRMRDLKVQEALYGLLVQQLEQARIEEQKNTPVLSVLDAATPGETAVYPRKMLIIAIAGAAGALWVGIFAVMVEKLRGRRALPEESAALAALAAEWARTPGWVRRVERWVVH